MDGARQWGVLSVGERGWEKNGDQGRDGIGPEGFIPRRWTRCIVVSVVTDWAVVRRVLDGVVVSVQ
jgi:hypothetical protein